MALKKNWQSGDTVYGTDLNAIATVADAAYKKPGTGIPETDLAAAVQTKLNAGGGGGGTVSSEDITDATAVGKGLIVAANAAAARSVIGAGTSNLALGSSSSTACPGDDERLSDARPPTAHGHAGSDITSGTVGYARLPVGTAANTVAAGNDSRFTDTRTPTDNSVTSEKIVDGAIVNADINAAAGIFGSKLAAAVQTSLGLADTAVQPAGLSSAIATAQQVAVNAQTGTSYTLVLADAAKAVECANAAGVTVTVPPHASVAFPVGSVLEMVQTGAGQVTLAPGAGVTLNAAVGLKSASQWAVMTLRKRGTNAWIVAGDVTA